MDDGDERAEQWRLRCQEVGARYAEAAAQVALLEADLAAERETMAQVVGSNSWKLTEPLRRVRRRGLASTPASADLFDQRMRSAYDAQTLSWPQPQPQTFNQKIWRRRLLDRRPILRTYCDKHASFEHAAKVLPAQWMPERLALVDTSEELAGLDLPAEYVVKAGHGCGGSAVVWDGPATRGQDWVQPWIRKSYRACDEPLDQVAADLGACLTRDYGWDALEWGYLGVPRQLVVETLYRGPGGGLPEDIGCFVFHGQVQVFLAADDRQRDTQRTSSWHDRQWNVLPIMHMQTQPRERPSQLDEIIEVAEALAADEEFVRVDFLMTASGPKFSELTPYSHGGNARFTTQAADEYLGGLW